MVASPLRIKNEVKLNLLVSGRHRMRNSKGVEVQSPLILDGEGFLILPKQIIFYFIRLHMYFTRIMLLEASEHKCNMKEICPYNRF
jgi:hypothetical protein